MDDTEPDPGVLVVFDLETTGFSPLPLLSRYNRIVQVCAMRLDTGATFASVVDPDMRIPPRSSAIHGITDKDVAGAPRWADALRRMILELELDEPTGRRVTLVAHNCFFFDEIVFMRETERSGATTQLPRGLRFWDSLPFMRAAYPGLEAYGLGALFEHFFSVPLTGAHRADADVRALAMLLREVVGLDRLRGAVAAKDRDALLPCSQLTDLRCVGPARAYQISASLGVETVSALRARLGADARADRAAVDRFARDVLGINNVSDRMLIIAQVMQLPLWDVEAIRAVMIEPRGARFGPDSHCLDEVDYYIEQVYARGRCARTCSSPSAFTRGRARIRLDRRIW